MRLTKRIVICEECGLQWVKPFWEPKWLAHRAAGEIHADYHESAFSPERHELIMLWREWERDRIIALIESSAVGGYADADYIVFLLKGKNENPIAEQE